MEEGTCVIKDSLIYAVGLAFSEELWLPQRFGWDALPKCKSNTDDADDSVYENIGEQDPSPTRGYSVKKTQHENGDTRLAQSECNMNEWLTYP